MCLHGPLHCLHAPLLFVSVCVFCLCGLLYVFIWSVQVLHGLLHVLLELGMKPVERAVDGYCGILHIDVIEKNGETYTYFTQS